MINIVNSLAELTALRDREELEIAAGLVAADLSGASSGRVWRIVRHLGELRLHERARLANRSIVIADPPSDLGELPALSSREELRACYDARATAPIHVERGGRPSEVFPISGADGVAGFLEISAHTPLPEDQSQLVSDFLRIYQNHLNVLDYGESDELTGLLNRKTFDAAFDHMTKIEAPPRHAAPFVRYERRRPTSPDQPRWLAVLDIDFFKRVNDRFGHACGDQVLVQTAQLMRATFRESDRLFRCGGEEFLAILEPTGPHYVEGVLERFRIAMESHPFPQAGCSVTVSIGYTRVASPDAGIAAFRRADAALYAAKQQGRNRVICFEDLPQSRAAADGPRAPADRMPPHEALRV
jgi:diguanylate cyclase (GGDEF)-like protein